MYAESMGLSDTNSIDIVLDATRHAKCTLLIVDGQAHTDQELRFNQFLSKLRGYVAYVISDQFAADHPGVEPNEVLIGVTCSTPPSEAMQAITQIRPHARPDALIRVSCVHYVQGGPMPWFVRPDGEPPPPPD